MKYASWEYDRGTPKTLREVLSVYQTAPDASIDPEAGKEAGAALLAATEAYRGEGVK